LEAEHWQTRSVSLQVVAEETASEIQVVAQAGIWAWTKPERAMMASAEYEYFILMVGWVVDDGEFAVNE